MFIDLEYEFSLDKPPAVIVDAGANIGFASIFFARKYPNAKILGIEPEASNFALLEKNVKPYRGVIPVRAALWSETKPINLIDPGIGHWGFQAEEPSTSSGNQRVRAEQVQGTTVDNLMRAYQIPYIDILKIDIEGGEKEVFENAASWIKNVGVIIIELHDRFKIGCSRSFYLATRDFEIEGKQGENVFMARAGYNIRANAEPARR